MKRNKQTVCSPIASVIREAAASGNQFARFLIQSRDYFAKVNEQNRKERKVVSLQQKILYTKHSKRRDHLKRELEQLTKAR